MFLQALHAQVTRESYRAVLNWMAWEGGHWLNTARYNPLNTTMAEPGATSINSVGVKRYLSWGQGLDATVHTIELSYYVPILAALRRGDGATIGYMQAMRTWGTQVFDASVHRSGLYATEGHIPGDASVAPPAPAPQGEEGWQWHEQVRIAGETLASPHKQVSGSLRALRGLYT
jgi:hypothetical protein